jgi:precorrin-4/cobalt-precorrin-4 C11-methyltransferase
MAIYLSSGMLDELRQRLLDGGYSEDTPAAIVYKATWPEEKKILCTVGSLAKEAEKENITKTAIVLVGDAVNCKNYDRSKLYDASFSTEFRKAVRTE